MLYERNSKRRFQEGKQAGVLEGLEEGREEMEMAWRSWMERREEALAVGEPFGDPPPTSKPSSNGQ